MLAYHPRPEKILSPAAASKPCSPFVSVGQPYTLTCRSSLFGLLSPSACRPPKPDIARPTVLGSRYFLASIPDLDTPYPLVKCQTALRIRNLGRRPRIAIP